MRLHETSGIATMRVPSSSVRGPSLSGDRYEWQDEYTTGVDSIDAQHRRLFGYLGELRVATSLQSDGAMRRVLDELLTYTVDHFAHEEALQEAAGYPHRAHHAQEHDRLQAQVVAYISRPGVTGQELLDVLGQWLIQHVVRSDRHAASFLKR